MSLRLRHLLPLLLLLLLSPVGRAWADDLALPGGTVQRISMPGGPTVLLQVVPELPTVSVATVIPAGSRFDEPGRAGQAHLMEHLLFRATSDQPGGTLLMNLERIGASAGARTTPETVSFWETVPAQYVDHSLDTQAGRLKALYASERDFQRERQLVERELVVASTPAAQLHQRLLSELWPSIGPAFGVKQDLDAMTLAALKGRYARTVDPRQAVIAVVGSFSAEQVEQQLHQLFPKPRLVLPAPPVAPLPEPRQVAGPVPIPGRACVEWLAPLPEPAPSLSALYLLDGALSRWALHAGRQFNSQILADQGLYQIKLIPAPGESVQAAQTALAQEVQHLSTAGPSAQQLQFARNRALARFYRELQDPVARARELAQRQLSGSLGQMASLPGQLKDAKPADVRWACRRLLAPGRVAEGQLTGQPPPPQATPDPVPRTTLGPGPRKPANSWQVKPMPARPAPSFVREQLDNGLTIIVQTVKNLPTVTVRGYLDGGAVLDPPGQPGLTYLAAGLLGRGTTAHPGRSFSWALQDLGLQLTFVPEQQVVAIHGWTPAADFHAFLGLLAEALRHPDPDKSALRQARARAVASLEQIRDNSDLQALWALRRHMYPSGHPYGVPAAGALTTARQATDSQIIGQLQRVSRPDRLVLVFCGDITEKQVLADLEPELSAWYVDSAPAPIAVPVAPPPAPTTLRLPGSGPGALVLMGHPGPTRQDPDYYAFNLLNQVLGGDPVSSRLALTLQDEQGLVTEVTSRVVPLSGPVPWAISMRTPPNLADKAVAAARQQILRLLHHPPSAAELKRAVRLLEGRLQVSQASASGRAELLASLEFHHLSASYPNAFSGIYDDITPQDVAAAARKWLEPNHLVTVISSP